MLIHPQFNPIALNLGPLAIHWYGLMYLIAFLGGALLARWRLQQPTIRAQGWTSKDIDDLLFYIVLGVILGGRLGYVLFYKASFYAENPLSIFKIWEGGMSFHGGFLGVLCAVTLFSWRRQWSWLQITDFIAPVVPLGIAAGRLGNFINGELWGRVTRIDTPWAMLFPQARASDYAWLIAHPAEAASKGLMIFYQQFGMLPRHASQLYEMALEGVLLLIVLWIFARKARPIGAVSALFLIGYGITRSLVEFTREPDDFLGLLALNLSMGQWLSIPMIIAGVMLMIWAYKRK